jgi:hypothetical protein
MHAPASAAAPPEFVFTCIVRFSFQGAYCVSAQQEEPPLVPQGHIPQNHRPLSV